MGTADLHVHTTDSDGFGTVPATLEAACRAGLDVVAITDHDRLQGALEALELAPHFGISVIPGTEITTSEGHLIALFVTRPVPPRQPLRDTVLRVAEQGGLCIAAHPMALGIGSLHAPNIIWALTDRDVARTLVAMEVYNGGLPYLANNRRAARLAASTGLARVASSDSHLLWTIGMCASRFPGSSPDELRAALHGRQTEPIVGERPLRFFSDWARARLLRLAGLAYSTPEPGGDLVLRRLSGA